MIHETVDEETKTVIIATLPYISLDSGKRPNTNLRDKDTLDQIA